MSFVLFFKALSLLPEPTEVQHCFPAALDLIPQSFLPSAFLSFSKSSKADLFWTKESLGGSRTDVTYVGQTQRRPRITAEPAQATHILGRPRADRAFLEGI